MTTDSINKLAVKLMPWVANALCAGLLWWAQEINTQLRQIQLEIQEIKEWKSSMVASRYTMTDAAIFAEKQSAEIAKLSTRLTEVEQKWLRDLGDIKVSIGKIEAIIDERSGSDGRRVTRND